MGALSLFGKMLKGKYGTPDSKSQKARGLGLGPITQRSPVAEGKHIGSLFDVPEPYRSHAIEIDGYSSDVIEDFKLRRGSLGEDQERLLNERFRELEFARDEMLDPEVIKQGLFKDGYFFGTNKPDWLIEQGEQDFIRRMGPY